MDATPEPGPPPDPATARSPLDHAELRSLFSHLSHELGRRLVSLRAGFDLLLGDVRPPVSSDQRDHLQTMGALCDDLLRLTRSYLDYAGLVQGARPLHYGFYTLGALIRDVDQEYAKSAAGRGIAWQCALDGDDATVRTDASRCQQILGNLVANALKYTPEGGRVRVSAGCRGPTWTLAVADDGHGIPADAIPKVFEPFYRLARDERSGVEGNGLGLAICRELIEQLKGEVAIDSELGRGTTVTARFPTEAETEAPRKATGKRSRG